jgi:hypothetical protein
VRGTLFRLRTTEQKPLGMIPNETNTHFREVVHHEMPPRASTANFTFNGAVGLVQTGDGSTASVHQHVDAGVKVEIAAALRTLIELLDKPEMRRSEAGLSFGNWQSKRQPRQKNLTPVR